MSKGSNPRPPAWALRLLRFAIHRDYLEEIEGDMEEWFQDQLEDRTPKQARRAYAFEVFKLLRPNLMSSLSRLTNPDPSGFHLSNIKMAFRVFRLDKVYTGVNILGLSTAIAISLFVLLYVDFEFSYEKGLPYSDRMVRVTLDILEGETVTEQDCGTYPQVGPQLKEKYPEVERFTRAHPIRSLTIGVGDQYFPVPKAYGVDPDFFDLFHYPFLSGNRQNAFLAPGEAVLTESLAFKVFGTDDVVGKSIRLPQHKRNYEIVGLVEDSRENSHLSFEMLISFPSMKRDFNQSDETWNQCNLYTYLLLPEDISYGQFQGSLKNYNEFLLEEKLLEDERIISEMMSDIHLYSSKYYEPDENADYSSILFLLGVALLVILLANINYVNLSTAKSLDRAREVGIRKAIGSSPGQLKIQFFTEAFIINIISALIAIFLLLIFEGPFKSVLGLPAQIHFYESPFFWATLLGVVLFSTLAAGAFPAFFLSAFQPIAVLKGQFFRIGKGIILRRSLVVFQFAITLLLLSQTLTSGEQVRFMLGQKLGFTTDQVVVVKTQNGRAGLEKQKLFRSALMQHSAIQNVTFSNTMPGRSSLEISTTTGIGLVNAEKENNYNFYIYLTDYNFLNTLEMELLSGEAFYENRPNENLLLINEKTAELFGIADPKKAVGQMVNFWDEKMKIHGVVKDFHQSSLRSEILPIIFLPWCQHTDFAGIRLNEGNVEDQIDLIRKEYAEVYPDIAFDFFFLDEEYAKQYELDRRFQKISGLLTGFAILIACLGLYGLTTFTVAKRTKEIGVRKVLGASIGQINLMLSREFMRLILISFVLSIPVTYFLIDRWLRSFAFRMDINPWLLVLPAIMILFIAFLTIFSKTLKVSRLNPVVSLRDE